MLRKLNMAAASLIAALCLFFATFNIACDPRETWVDGEQFNVDAGVADARVCPDATPPDSGDAGSYQQEGQSCGSGLPCGSGLACENSVCVRQDAGVGDVGSTDGGVAPNGPQLVGNHMTGMTVRYRGPAMWPSESRIPQALRGTRIRLTCGFTSPVSGAPTGQITEDSYEVAGSGDVDFMLDVKRAVNGTLFKAVDVADSIYCWVQPYNEPTGASNPPPLATDLRDDLLARLSFQSRYNTGTSLSLADSGKLFDGLSVVGPWDRSP